MAAHFAQEKPVPSWIVTLERYRDKKMQVVTQSRFEQAKQDVSRIFSSPDELCDAPDLSTDEKVYLLKQWETDLRLLLVASEENMPGTHPGRTAELLQSVLQKLEDLGVPKEDTAANKAGG